jgi:diaminopimelate decarboxylase
LVRVLSDLVVQGAGLECASLEEVFIALAAGAKGRQILFDSPAKTMSEIEFALGHGLTLNLDNEDEIQRVNALLQSKENNSGGAWVGLRVNPTVGEGTIAATSVGGVRSRFGIAFEAEETVELVNLFQEYPWLSGLHVHVGSQGCTLEQLALGARRAVDLALEIERRTETKLKYLDIGGGLPVDYGFQAEPVTLTEYGELLRTEVPELFEGRWRIYTEFGRAIHANAAVAISKVEYVKTLQDSTAGVLHFGADMFMRPVYAAKDWRHEFVVLDSEGREKAGEPQSSSLVGPLCFGGDVLAESVILPPLQVGDMVGIRDAGAYTLSLWSRHCNRGMPLVLYWDSKNRGFEKIRKREMPEDVASFWQ